MQATPAGGHHLVRLRRYAELLDSGIELPIIHWRIGLDPLLGLIPGAGDAIGAVLAGWILLEGVRLGASAATLIRIAGNIAFDTLSGAVPVLGDLIDFAWKANDRNIALLERHLAEPHHAARADRRFVVLLLAGTGAICLVPIVLALYLLLRLLGLA